MGAGIPPVPPTERLTYFVDLRADSKGGNTVASDDAIFIRSNQTRDPIQGSLDSAFQNAISGRDVFLVTHGFHVNRDDGIDYLHRWHQWLDLGDNGYFVGVLWPGDSKWLHGLDYPGEYDVAVKSGQLLALYVDAHFNVANSISFASHSLGARVMLETVKGLPGHERLRSLTIMAGAIDDTCLVDEYGDAAENLSRISVLASKCDDVLQWLFPEGNLAAGIISRGDPYWHGALGRYGPNPPNQPSNLYGSPILPDKWNFGHGSYINCVHSGYSPALAPPQPYAPLPLVVPSTSAGFTSAGTDGQQAWAAGFCSSRFRY